MGFLSSFKMAVRSVGSSVKNAVKSAGSSVKKAVQSVGSSVQKHVKNFKRDVLNKNGILGGISGAVEGYISGGPYGAISGAVAGVASGREQTLAERRALKESEDSYIAEDYTIADNGAVVGNGFVDVRSPEAVVRDTLKKVAGTSLDLMSPKQRYDVYTAVLKGSARSY